MISPQFPKDEDDQRKPGQDEGYLLKNRHGRTIRPLHSDLQPAMHATHHFPRHHDDKPAGNQADAAVDLIRRKLDAIYGEEPDAQQELVEVAQPIAHPSKHQVFMQQLSNSGKPLAQIQVEWHNYYLQLPDEEKHEVWREFYQNNARQPSAYTTFVAQNSHQQAAQHQPPGTGENHHPKVVVAEHPMPLPAMPSSHRDRRTKRQIKKQIVNRVLASAESQKKVKQHFQSLAFGIGTGLLVLLIFLFGFFNEMFIAPFIQPSRHVSATPIIVNADSVAPSDTPEVIIPKINVQIPVVYDEPSIEESAVQRALERGVIHYATTVNPGQQGNATIFGHSSNNIFNKGKYKFAFVLLRELVPGDIFYLTYEKKVYTYRVFDKKVVAPTEVSVLNSIPGKPATAALITCDPPGTSTNRLVVWGEQISPDPSGAPTAVTPPSTTTPAIPTELPSEGPTLWSRFWGWVF